MIDALILAYVVAGALTAATIYGTPNPVSAYARFRVEVEELAHLSRWMQPVAFLLVTFLMVAGWPVFMRRLLRDDLR